VWIPNEKLRTQYNDWAKEYKQTEFSLFGQLAAKVAYETGDDWAEGLLATIEDNYHYAKARLTAELPDVVVADLEGTYLMWVDLRAYIAPDDIKGVVQDKAKLAIDFGEWFSPEAKRECCVTARMRRPFTRMGDVSLYSLAIFLFLFMKSFF
jgi:cystathionine beta-lyase